MSDRNAPPVAAEPDLCSRRHTFTPVTAGCSCDTQLAGWERREHQHQHVVGEKADEHGQQRSEAAPAAEAQAAEEARAAAEAAAEAAARADIGYVKLVWGGKTRPH